MARRTSTLSNGAILALSSIQIMKEAGNRLHGDVRHVLQADDLEWLQVLRDVDGAALKQLDASGRGRHFPEDDRIDRRLAAIVVGTRLEDGLLAAHKLLELVGAEAGAVVLDEFPRPGIVGAAFGLALHAVVDRACRGWCGS